MPQWHILPQRNLASNVELCQRTGHPSIFCTNAQHRVDWLDHILQQLDNHSSYLPVWPTIYRLDNLSARHIESGMTIFARPSSCSTWHWGMSDALLRLWELEGQGSSHGINNLIIWDLRSKQFNTRKYLSSTHVTWCYKLDVCYKLVTMPWQIIQGNILTVTFSLTAEI